MSKPPPGTYVALDLEATGGGDDDEIIEIGAVKFDANEVLDHFDTLIRPKRLPSLRVQELTGIEPNLLRIAPSFADVKSDLSRFLGDLPIVAHSVDRDLERLVRQGIAPAGLGIDTYELATILLPGLASHGLHAVAGNLGIGMVGSHRALPDAETTRAVFLSLYTRLIDLGPRTLSQLSELLSRSDWSLRPLFQRAAQSVLHETLNTPNFTRRMDVPPLGELLRQGDTTAALEPRGVPRPLDLGRLRAVWSANGPLARGFPNYQPRPSQEEMSLAIGAAFNNGGRLLVEAGTGTGKTLAYLVPAAGWAAQNGERVLISTNTVNLQDQILTKDVPELQRALGESFRVQVVKGRSNYLCLMRWAEFRSRHPNSSPLTSLESRVLVKVLLWLERSATGDVVDLNLIGEEQKLWSQIAATRETCINDACIYKQRHQCFLFNARRAAESAHLVVVNHALLLSDLAADNGVLPEYEYLIIDEGHHLEDQATQHLGFNLSQRDVFALLAEISSAGEPRRHGSLTQELGRLIGTTSAVGSRVAAQLQQAESAVERARTTATQFFLALATLLVDVGKSDTRRGTKDSERSAAGFERQTRVTPDLRAHRAWPAIDMAWEDWATALAEIQRHLEHLGQSVSSLPDSDDLERQRMLLQSCTRRLLQIRAELEAMIQDPDDGQIYWFGEGDQTDAVSMHSAPLHVGEALETLLFAPRKTVVLTSATLSVNGRFDYVRERLTLGSDVKTVALDSPFDYQKQALLLLPEDLVDPFPAATSQLHQALVDFALATQGRCLVLFTSNAALRAAYRAIKEPVERKGVVVVAQGVDGSRGQLVEALRSNHATVILGSASFWEGVDIAGAALSALVIMKLPFAVPSDPIFAARSEQYRRPFDEYAVPLAAIRFKQGFGRLIRTVNDRGVLLVLDGRLTAKYYGPQFLRSLPNCTVKRIKVRDIGITSHAWLA